MARKTKEELQQIMDSYGVDRLWSWSRFNCYKNDCYEYFLKYILHKREDRKDQIYCVSGGYAHDILQDLYEGKIKYSDMIDRYEDSLLTMNLDELKYNRTDAEMNEKIANKYESCLKHFFTHYNVLKDPCKVEFPILIKVSDNIVFVGYVDFLHISKDENSHKHIIITDFKTSSEYKGDKILKEAGQLILYSEGVRQKLNIPLEDITARWNFLKYVVVQCQQIKGTWKERHIERNAIGEKLSSSAKTWLKNLGYAPEDIDNYLADMIVENDISCLPEEVQSKFVISDCYVNIPLSEEIVNNLKEDIIKTEQEIREKEKEYEETEDDHVFWEDVTDDKSYYLANLSGYSRNLHKPFDEYLKEKEMFENKDKEQDTNNDNDTEDSELADFLNSL